MAETQLGQDTVIRALHERLVAAERTNAVLADKLEKMESRAASSEPTNLALTDLVRLKTTALKQLNDNLMKEAIQRRNQARLLNEMQRIANMGGWEYNPTNGSVELTEQAARILMLPAGTEGGGGTPGDGTEPGVDVPGLRIGGALACFPDSVRVDVKLKLDAAVRNRAPFEVEINCASPEGGVRGGRVVLIEGHPLIEQEKVTRIYGAIRDITEQRHAEAQLAQAQRLESIGQLAAGIAHEINTPTQYVSDNVRFLRDQFNNLVRVIETFKHLLEDPGSLPWSERREIIGALLEEIDYAFLLGEVPQALSQSLDGLERITRIVLAMRDFSHPGNTHKEAVDINKAIETTVEVARNRWKYVADVEFDLDRSLPPVPCLLGDFNQVILNLVINAADAISERYGKESEKRGVLRISTRAVKENLEIRISDNGCGIPERVQARIFEPFFTTKPVGRGTGQGLSICNNIIVRKHGGAMRFESLPGVGSTFIVSLPMRTGDEGGTADEVAGVIGRDTPSQERAA